MIIVVYQSLNSKEIFRHERREQQILVNTTQTLQLTLVSLQYMAPAGR